MVESFDALAAELGKLGAKFRIVSIARLESLSDELQAARREGKIDERLYASYLSGFRFAAPDDLPGAKSIIVVAVPQGSTVLHFTLNGKHLRTVIPPTYIYSKIRGACTAALSRALEGTGGRAVKAVLPLKLLAVRSGLAQYGRNNISYVEGMGSFHRLEAFFTDHELRRDDWQEKGMMARCENCSLCREACPTKAIRGDRFLIDAGICLTYFNENEGAIPEWIDPRAHNAIIGCMRCQLACPANSEFLSLTESVESFSEEETEILAKGGPKEKLPQGLAAKLERLNMDGYYEILSRNLALLPWE